MNTSNNNAVLEMVDHKATIDERGYNSNFEIVCVEKMLRDYIMANGYKDVIYFNVKCQLIRKDEGVIVPVLPLVALKNILFKMFLYILNTFLKFSPINDIIKIWPFPISNSSASISYARIFGL